MSQPRDDYKELLLLSLVFLDGWSTETFVFKRPGAMHHARWMSKAINSLKIFLFRDQFHLTIRETKNLRQICIFVILFYIKAWYTSTSAILAPNNDLELFKKLISYETIDRAVSQKACKKMKEHLWYLNEELPIISLFDTNVSVNIKIKMIEFMNTREAPTKMSQRYKVLENEFDLFLKKDLSDFVSKKSLDLFKKFDLSCDFLEKNILTWSHEDSYNECAEFFKTLKVTNDVAERGVALIEEYNNYLTKDEQQLQYLLQVVRQHRQRYSKCYENSLQQY